MISDPKSEIEKNLIRVSPILYLRSSTIGFLIHEITLESRFWPQNVPIWNEFGNFERFFMTI